MSTERDANFYMANLGSEMTRLIAARERRDRAAFSSSLKRCLALADRAFAAAASQAHRDEIAMVKDVIIDLAKKEPRYSITKESVASYFYPFALKQMANKQ